MKTITSITNNLFGSKSWRSCLRLLLALVLLGWGALAQAQSSDVWTNVVGNNNWSPTNNWLVNGNPAVGLTNNGGDNLTFGPMGINATYRSTNDFPAALVTIGNMTFNTNGYFIGGNALQITNGITDTFGSNNISLAFTLQNSQTFQNTAAASTNLVTTIVQPVSFGPNNSTLTIAGTGDLYIKGTGSSASVLTSGTNGGGMVVVSTSGGGIFMMGPGNSSIANAFGSNWVTTAIVFTNLFTTVTNTVYWTNALVVVTNGVSTNTTLTYITNTTVITTYSNGTQYVLATNSNFQVQDAVRVDAGTLQLFNSLSLPNGALVGNLSVDGLMDLNGMSPTVNGLEDQGSPNGVIDNVAASLTGIYTLTVGNASSNGIYNGIIRNSSGSVALTKTGFGTEVLMNGNQYSGGTIINQGVLMLSNSIPNSTVGSLGASSTILTINAGAVFDISALNAYGGYVPPGALTVNAGTPVKPYTNFYGSYFPFNPATTNFVVSISGTNNQFTFVTNILVTGGVPATNIVTTTNFVAVTYSTNSIVSIINYDVIGDFTVNGGGQISPITTIAPGIATWSIDGDLSIDSSRTLPTVTPNRVNFLLNNVTNAGGGINDLIAVTGQLFIGDELDVAVTPLTGSLVGGGGQKYTLFTSTGGYVAHGNTLNGYTDPANIIPIVPRGITPTITSDANNIYLAASGTVAPGNIIWRGTPTANNWDVKKSQNWVTNAPSHASDFYFAGDYVNFDDTGVGSIILPVVQAPGSMTFNNNATNYSFVSSANTFITGPGGLTLNGSGQVTLNNPNSFTGDVTINNGTLILGTYFAGNNVDLYNGITPGKLIFGNLGQNENFWLNQNVVNSSHVIFLSGFTLNTGANAQINTYLGRAAGAGIRVIMGDQITRNVGSSIYFAINGGGSANTEGQYFTNTIPWSNGIMFGGYGHNGTDWIAGQTNYPTAPVNSYSYTGYSNNVGQVSWLSTNNISLNSTNLTLTAPGATINTLRFTGAGSILTLNSGTTLTNTTGGLLVSSGALGPNTIQGGTLMGAAGADLVIIQNYPVAPLYIGSVIADSGGLPTALTLGGLGGTVIITNTASYSGATYINNGTLQIGNGTALGNINSSSAIYDDSALIYNLSVPVSQGVLRGYGSLAQSGSSIVTLTADNPLLTGPVTVNSGVLQLGNGGSAGSISNVASLVDNATLVFNNSGNTGYPQPISGTGNVVNGGAGNLIIATNEAYTGNTIVSNGAIVLTSSGSISNAAGIIVNSGAVFDASASGFTMRGAVPTEILAGSGAVKGTLATSGGATITPGTNGVLGDLHFMNDLTFNGGNLIFDVGTNGNDHIYVGGHFNQTVGLVYILQANTLTNGVYNLVKATNGLTGSAANLAVYIPGIPLGTLGVLTNATANTLDLLVYSGFSTALFWQGDGTQNYWNSSANSLWKDSGNVTRQYANADIVTFDDSGNNALSVSLNGGSVYPNTVTVNSTNENYTIGDGGATYSANVISGGASLTKNGSGTLTVQSMNAYVGATVINGGTVQLNGAGTASTADGMIGANNVITNNGTLIVNNAANETISGALYGNGSLVQKGIGTLTLTANNGNFSGPVTIASNILQVGNGFTGTLGTGPVTNNGALNFNVGGSQVVPVNISGTGSVTNLAGTAGTVTLAGTNTYSGITEIDAGKIVDGSSAGISSATSLILNNNTNGASSVGTFDLSGHNVTVANLLGNNTGNASLQTVVQGTIINNGTTTNLLIINGGGTNQFNGNLFDNNNNGGLTGPAHGAFGLVIIGGQFTLLAPWSGADVIPHQVFRPNVFGGGVNGPGITVSNATLVICGSASGSSIDNSEGQKAIGGNPSGNQNLTLTGTRADYWESGALGGNGGGGCNTTSGILTVTTNTFATIYGPQRGTATFSALSGGGTIVYQTDYVRGQVNFGNATNFYGTIIFGQWRDTSGGNLGLQGTGFPNGNVVLGSTNISGMLMGGANANTVMPFGSLSGGDNTFTLAGGDQPSSDGNASVVYAIGGLNQTNVVGAILNGTGEGIRKVGTGMLTFTNNILSYAGQTVVSNGILAYAPLGNMGNFFGTTGFNPLTNNFLVGSNFTIVSPGVLDLSLVPTNTLYLNSRVRAQTLYGNGTLVGNLVVTNAIVAPGRRASSANVYPGSLTVVSNAVFGTNSTFQMSYSYNATNTPPLGYDNLNVLGTMTIQQASLVVYSNGTTAFAPLTTNVFRFFSNSVPVHIQAVGDGQGITNITVPTLPPGMFWRTNLNGTLAGYPTIPAGSMAIINTNNPTSVLLLQGLVVTPAGVLTPAFTSNTFSYTAVESYLHGSVTVTPTNWDTTASNRVIYLGVTNGVASGAASGSLTLNANPNFTNVVVVNVTGQDGVSVTNYTIAVIRHPDLTPGLLTPVINNNVMTMNWPLSENGYQVQAQTNALGIGLSNNWTVVAGSTLTNKITIIIDSNQPSVFYRLINTNSP